MTRTDHDAKPSRGVAPSRPARPAGCRARPVRAVAICALALALPLPPVSALSSATAGASPLPGAPGCQIFPPDNVWNTPVANLPVDPRSAQYIAAIGPGAPLHPDFGQGDWDGEPMGIPYNVVPGAQPKVPVHFMYASESDPGPYPIPPGAQVEGGPTSTGDRHVIVVNTGNCTDYEMWSSYPQRGGTSWRAGSGAVFPLDSDKLRPAGWTSADAAGLPILPGLARYDEVSAGAITHALRFTVSQSQAGFIHPATHFASSSTNPALPPMGLRLRLKASYDISSFTGQSLVILTALKKYGMIVADNGSSWFITGAPDPGWNNNDLDQLKKVPGSALEVVVTGTIQTNE